MLFLIGTFYLNNLNYLKFFLNNLIIHSYIAIFYILLLKIIIAKTSMCEIVERGSNYFFKCFFNNQSWYKVVRSLRVVL